MPGIKTAISLDTELYEQVTAKAREMHISRSRFFALAARDYLRQQENQQLLTQLNAAYDDVREEEETVVAEGMREKHRRMAEGDAWQ